MENKMNENIIEKAMFTQEEFNKRIILEIILPLMEKGLMESVADLKYYIATLDSNDSAGDREQFLHCVKNKVAVIDVTIKYLIKEYENGKN